MNKNTIIITIISIIAVFGFLTAAYVLTSRPAQVKEFPELKQVKSQDHIKWSKAKKHILVEYSDFQCPACQNFHTLIKAELDTDKSITDKITFVYRHFPLQQHQYSRDAAYAAEAAANQGKFFEMGDKMFTTQNQWSTSKNAKQYFETLAKDLKLDIAEFNKDRESQQVKNRVESDVTSGTQVEVQATPSFYLDGKKIENISSFADFKKMLQDAAKN